MPEAEPHLRTGQQAGPTVPMRRTPMALGAALALDAARTAPVGKQDRATRPNAIARTSIRDKTPPDKREDRSRDWWQRRSLSDIHSPAGCDHAAHGRHPAGGLGGLSAVARFRATSS